MSEMLVSVLDIQLYGLAVFCAGAAWGFFTGWSYGAGKERARLKFVGRRCEDCMARLKDGTE